MINNRSQKGEGAIVFILFILFFAMVVKGAFNILPIFIENRTVKSVIEGFLEDQEDVLIARQEMMEAIDKRLIVNGVGNITSKDFRVVRKGGQRFLVANYSSAVPYIFNIDLVVNFDNIRFDITDISVL